MKGTSSWRLRARAVAVVDMVLNGIAAVVVGVTAYMSLSSAQDDEDASGVEHALSKFKLEIDDDVDGWPLWLTLASLGVIILIQFYADILLFCATNITVDPNTALRLAFIWAVSVALVVSFSSLASLPKLHFAAVIILVFWRGIFLLDIFMFFREPNLLPMYEPPNEKTNPSNFIIEKK